MSVDEKETGDKPDENEITLLDLLATLLSYKRLIIFITALSAGAAVLVSIVSLLLPPKAGFLPNVYASKAVMLVNGDSGGSLSSLLSSSGMGSLASLAGVSGGKSYGDLAVYIAKSIPILDELVSRFNLEDRYKIKQSVKSETRTALLGKYTATYAEKTGLLTVSFEDIDPVFARDVVNYAVDLIDKRFTTIGGNRNLTRKVQLEGKLSDVQAEMKRLEGEIQKFQQKYGILSVETMATEQIGTVAKVRSELIMKEMEIKTYQDTTKVEDPALRRLKLERDNLSKLLGELEKGFSSYQNVMPSQKDIPRLAIEFSTLQRDYLVQGEIYKLLVQQYELTKLSLSGEDPIIQILELAEAPDKKSGPSRGMICIVAVIGGFFLSVLLALALKVIKNIQSDPEAMAKLRGVRG